MHQQAVCPSQRIPGSAPSPPTHHIFIPRGRELMGSTSYLWGKAGEFYWCLAFLLEY